MWLTISSEMSIRLRMQDLGRFTLASVFRRKKTSWVTKTANASRQKTICLRHTTITQYLAGGHGQGTMINALIVPLTLS
uniref:Uncharacterized protein n=1 Tax=Caenorhabditis japonica TaxID=281687 RepID=A0A8R1EP72_CAEJA